MQIAETKFDDDPAQARRGKGLSVALWTTQIVLAALFLFSGAMKFITPAAQMSKQTTLPLSFIYFIGVCEMLGGVGLILPALLRILPVLTPLAASGLVIIMLGATYVSRSMGWTAIIPFVIGLIAAFIAYGRFRLRPIQPRLQS